MAKITLTKPQEKLLNEVADATLQESFVFVSLKNNKPLEKLLSLGFVEVNDEITNENEEVACRATTNGISFLNPVEQGTDEEPELPITETIKTGIQKAIESEKPRFELESGLDVPKSKRGGRGRSLYPFDEMEVGHSFHVPATEEIPKPHTKLASTVASANNRLKRDGITDRKFVNRQAASDDPKGPGARVHCVAVD